VLYWTPAELFTGKDAGMLKSISLLHPASRRSPVSG
jgi:hypothetical protein